MNEHTLWDEISVLSSEYRDLRDTDITLITKMSRPIVIKQLKKWIKELEEIK